jgi:hypothetical protein
VRLAPRSNASLERPAEEPMSNPLARQMVEEHVVAGSLLQVFVRTCNIWITEIETLLLPLGNSCSPGLGLTVKMHDGNDE